MLFLNDSLSGCPQTHSETVRRKCRSPNSCGCLARERSAHANLTHGHAKKHSLTYNSWHAMLGRCRYQNHRMAHRYINRGITVCERWQHFLADMGERPVGHTLDRINNDLSYFKDNCRWIPRYKQAENRCATKLTPEKAVEIALRRLCGEKLQTIAKAYSISPQAVGDIAKGRKWKRLSHNGGVPSRPGERSMVTRGLSVIRLGSGSLSPAQPRRAG